VKRYCTMTFPLLMAILAADASADQHLSQAALQEALMQESLMQDASQHCDELAQLRSVDTNAALNDLYQRLAYVPLWHEPAQLRELQTQLRNLADDGLNPEDYAYALQATAPNDACEELRISAQYLLALEHLSRGRLDQAEFETVWHADSLPSFTPVDLALGDSIAASFDRARPAFPQYQALRAAYAAMDKNPLDQALIASGPLLRPGMNDERIEQISRQLQAHGFISEAASSGQYDEQQVQAVQRFQVNHGLSADGIIGPQTLQALNTSPRYRVQQVQINLERLRWINAHRSDYLLLVNIASGHLQLMQGNTIVWQARAQTGRASRPTPALVSTINRITLNPSWTIPPTILRQDVLPQIRRDPEYLASHGMLTLNAQGEPIDPAQVDWRNPRGLVLRQPPGPTNPLGQLVFRLPNPFSIYLHDTPSQHLFAQSNRNVSSGCVRVEQALGLAEHLLASLPDERRQLIAEQLASGLTHEVALPEGPQVILAYWTASANDEGKPAFVPDIYGRDTSLIAAMTSPLSKPEIEIANTRIDAEAGCAFSEA
jgi:L,D-transpeptidase YcbB